MTVLQGAPMCAPSLPDTLGRPADLNDSNAVIKICHDHQFVTVLYLRHADANHGCCSRGKPEGR